MTGLIGESLAHYAIQGILGSGGMGDVYVAEDSKLGRRIALKVLPPSLAGLKDRRERFLREAKAIAALNHPNIVTIYSVEEDRGLHFITLELVEGVLLREIIDAGPLPIERFRPIARQICKGLACAHAAGVLHRDLKPHNIMVTADERVKLLDFGLAKLMQAPSETDAEAATMVREGTSPGMTIGTAGYMAPEQALGHEVDQRADLFACGVVLYEMATGKSPFRGETLAALFDELLNKPPLPPLKAHPAMAPELAALLERALEKNPERRYQSAEELLEALRQWDRPAGDRPANRRPERRARASIAVLPFSDLSPEKDQAYFCHGLAEELISALSSIEALRVVARTSSFSLAEQGLDIEQIGARLRVGVVLEGSVRKAGTRVRVTSQLVDAKEGHQLWSKRFDRELTDVFAIQDEIAETIARELQSELGTARLRSDARRSDNLKAYDAYLRGLYSMNRWTSEWVHRAIDSFEEAVRKDPEFALAHACLAQCHLWFFSGIGIYPAAETIPRARTAAEKALALDPSLAEAHLAAALIAMNHDWDRNQAAARFSRAIELNPNSADARLWNAWRLALMEARYHEALEELGRAEDLDPLDLKVKTQIGYVYYFLRDLPRAIDQFESVLALEPHFAFGHYALGDVFAHQGRYREAIDAFEQSARLGGRSVNHIALLAYSHGLQGKPATARSLLLELDARSKKGYASAVWRAVALLGLGEPELAIDSLERAFGERDGSLILTTVASEFDSIREHPRFQSLLERMGLGHLTGK